MVGIGAQEVLLFFCTPMPHFARTARAGPPEGEDF